MYTEFSSNYPGSACLTYSCASLVSGILEEGSAGCVENQIPSNKAVRGLHYDHFETGDARGVSCRS